MVGVWIGNDDNSSLGGVTGSGLPARIWKDFMQRALSVEKASGAANPTPTGNPLGRIEPLDVPEVDDVPTGQDGMQFQLEDGGVILRTDVDGIPIDVRMNREGVQMDDAAIERARREAEERVRQGIREAEDRARATVSADDP